MLSSSAEIDDAERAQLLPWTATLKQHYVRITPSEISGRRFTFGPEAQRGPRSRDAHIGPRFWDSRPSRRRLPRADSVVMEQLTMLDAGFLEPRTPTLT